MFGAFDDAGRLYITESGDGHFKQARVFADRFVPSMGVAWRDGKLYVAETKDGESGTGSLARETPESVVLRNAIGALTGKRAP